MGMCIAQFCMSLEFVLRSGKCYCSIYLTPKYDIEINEAAAYMAKEDL